MENRHLNQWPRATQRVVGGGSFKMEKKKKRQHSAIVYLQKKSSPITELTPGVPPHLPPVQPSRAHSQGQQHSRLGLGRDKRKRSLPGTKREMRARAPVWASAGPAGKPSLPLAQHPSSGSRDPPWACGCAPWRARVCSTCARLAAGRPRALAPPPRCGRERAWLACGARSSRAALERVHSPQLSCHLARPPATTPTGLPEGCHLLDNTVPLKTPGLSWF